MLTSLVLPCLRKELTLSCLMIRSSSACTFKVKKASSLDPQRTIDMAILLRGGSQDLRHGPAVFCDSPARFFFSLGAIEADRSRKHQARWCDARVATASLDRA
jgi:hypothetical protein